MLISTNEAASASLTSAGRLFTFDRDGKARELGGILAVIDLIVNPSESPNVPAAGTTVS